MSIPDTAKTNVVGVVGRIFKEDNYAVVYPHRDFQSCVPEGTSITFSLSRWGGSLPPQKDDVVWLLGVTEGQKGWRADSALPSQQHTSSKRKG